MLIAVVGVPRSRRRILLPLQPAACAQVYHCISATAGRRVASRADEERSHKAREMDTFAARAGMRGLLGEDGGEALD
eukprot:COSAG06_NODE_23486_length_690_cov_0.986464_1_plen_76_part_10